jgi:sarcosine oxidase subunit beta
VTTTADVAIVGGGLHGCSAAVHLARRGIRALVIEKDHVGRHASGVNAGGVRRLGRHLAEVPISASSAAWWAKIEDLVDDDCEFRPTGQIKVAENEADLAKLEARAAEVRAIGFNHEEIIGQDELRALVPAIAEYCVGALIVRGDGHANPMRACLAFKRKVRAGGGRIWEGAAVTGAARQGGAWRLETTAGAVASPVVVNCAGAWGDRIAALLGDSVRVIPRAPMLMITARMPHFIDPVMGAASRSLSFKQFDNGTVLIGGDLQGIARRDANKTELVMGTLSSAAKTAWDLFPVMRGSTVTRFWAGIEGYMPDGIPVIGPGRAAGVVHAFGFSAHGFQMSPGVGAIVADLVESGRSSLPIAPFRVDRF